MEKKGCLSCLGCFGIIVLLSVVIVSFSMCGNSKNDDKVSDESVYTVAQDAPEPNTTDMTEYIIKTARSNAESATDANIDYALNWIKANKADFFKDNATMEAAIYYGSLLGYIYKDEDLKKIADKEDKKRLLDNIGHDTQQAVKYVYRKVETIEDTATQVNLRQIEKSLVKIK